MKRSHILLCVLAIFAAAMILAVTMSVPSRSVPESFPDDKVVTATISDVYQPLYCPYIWDSERWKFVENERPPMWLLLEVEGHGKMEFPVTDIGLLVTEMSKIPGATKIISGTLLGTEPAEVREIESDELGVLRKGSRVKLWKKDGKIVQIEPAEPKYPPPIAVNLEGY